jgi:hypothetical protein
LLRRHSPSKDGRLSTHYGSSRFHPNAARPGGHFVSGLDEAQKLPKRNESFARRNETFRNAGRKSLKSL